MVAAEVVDFHAHVRQLADFPQNARVALGDYRAVLVPKVEHVAQQVNGVCLVLDAVQKIGKSAFLRAAVGDG